MSGIALVLLALAVSDLSHGLEGTPRSRVAALRGAAIGTLVAGVIGGFVLDDGAMVVSVVAVALVVAGAWQTSRVGGATPQVDLSLLGLSAVALVGVGTWWEAEGTDADLSDRLDAVLPFVDGFSDDAKLLLLAVALLQVSTANAIVRSGLAVLIDGDPPSTRIRGGRIIGPLERLMIVGFVVAGSPTTAALVVTAKSLLRYPELKAHDDGDGALDIHAVTEYVLIGSLLSWSFALAGALLLVD